MTKIVIVEKSGSLKTVQLKNFDVETICKKAGIKSLDGFQLQHTWGAEDGLDENISLYAKTEGRAGQENKYDFPPPADNWLFFGPCVLVGRNPETGEALDLDETEWEDIYEYLFGGFEDIGSEDSEEDRDTEDELEDLKAAGITTETTKHGYIKDGFIADSEYEEEESETEESEYSDEEEIVPIKKRGVKKTIGKLVPVPKKKKAVAVVVPKVAPMAENGDIEDCGDELSVESYE